MIRASGVRSHDQDNVNDDDEADDDNLLPLVGVLV